jgi:hypothetical protein
MRFTKSSHATILLSWEQVEPTAFITFLFGLGESPAKLIVHKEFACYHYPALDVIPQNRRCKTRIHPASRKCPGNPPRPWTNLWKGTNCLRHLSRWPSQEPSQIGRSPRPRVRPTYYSRNFFAWDLGRSQNYRGGGPISEVPKNSVKMGLGRSTLNKLAKNNL